jgi:tryptophan 2,3-dioxygenase
MPYPVYYHDYLQLDKILNAQQLESDLAGDHAHDEMLFIIIHQAYEIWFKQVLFETSSVIDVFNTEQISDNSNQLQLATHRLNRVVEILKVLVHQIDILETMTPMEFMEFRDYLRPASGFQSLQFKVLEARLGLQFSERHGQEYYLSQLKPEHVTYIKEMEKLPTLMNGINQWLERFPFLNDKYWQHLKSDDINENLFWNKYRTHYASTLDEREKANLSAFDDILIHEKHKLSFSAKALRSALFIMLYRGEPLMHLPFRLLHALLDIDEQLSTWRFRHINMVHRMIGSRIGTGGSTGKEYLQGALNKHYIFKDLAMLTSFMMNTKKLPVLSNELKQLMGFK